MGPSSDVGTTGEGEEPVKADIRSESKGKRDKDAWDQGGMGGVGAKRCVRCV